MQKTQATRLEQLNHPKASQECAKTRRGSQATKAFKASKGTKKPKARPYVVRCLRYIMSPYTKYLTKISTSQQSNIPIFKHFNSTISPRPNIWRTTYHGPTFS